MKYLALIFDGFEEEEGVASFALLRRAGADLDIASFNTTVNARYGLTLSNIKLIKDLDLNSYDVLIIPGGGGQYKFIMSNNEVLSIIKKFHDDGKVLCGICAAPTIFGALGLLKGKNYTCFTSMNDDFGGTYHDTGVVVDGKIITGRSVAYSIEFAYKIIEETMGKAQLDKVHEQIYYEK